MNLDTAKELLIDYILSAVVYRCKSCGLEFYTTEIDIATVCPFCRGEVYIDNRRRVEIIDWGSV